MRTHDSVVRGSATCSVLDHGLNGISNRASRHRLRRLHDRGHATHRKSQKTTIHLYGNGTQASLEGSFIELKSLVSWTNQIVGGRIEIEVEEISERWTIDSVWPTTDRSRPQEKATNAFRIWLQLSMDFLSYLSAISVRHRAVNDLLRHSPN